MAGAGAEIEDTVEPDLKINNFGSTTAPFALGTL